MWNILWVLLPIFGWFALGGYGIRIVKEFSHGKFKKLPVMSFGSDMKLGFFMFLKSLVLIIPYVIVITILGQLSIWLRVAGQLFIGLFMLPILMINFFNKETIDSLYEFKVLGPIFDNLGDYVTALLKSFALGIIFLIMIIVLVGFPAGSFTKNIFLADFYWRRVK